MHQTSSNPSRSISQPDAARVALFIDADHFRLCATRAHKHLTGSTTSAQRVNIDGEGMSQWVARASVELAFEDAGASRHGRSSRRIYDVLDTDRRQRWEQRRYHGVLQAEGFLVKAARAHDGNGMQMRQNSDSAARAQAGCLGPDVVGLDGDARSGRSIAEAALASDLVSLTASGQIDTAVLIAGNGTYAGPIGDARAHGAEVIVLVPPASAALIAASVREAATRAIALHPEVFETLYHVCENEPRRGAQRACAG